MEDHPAVRRSKILTRFGRVSEAIATVETALAGDPTNEALVLELQALRQRGYSVHSPSGWKHQVVGWLCLLGAFAVVFGPVLWAVRFFKSQLSAPEGPFALVCAAAFLAALVMLVLLASRLFLWCWFIYLRSLAPEVLPIAEERLAVAMNLYAFEPQYSRARESHLGRADA